MEEKEILRMFSIYLRANSLEANPPLSTILGNYGVNTIKFCERFNEFTKDLPTYLILKTRIILYVDKTFDFGIEDPSVSFLLRLVAKETSIFFKTMGGFKKKSILVVGWEDFLLIVFFKFGKISEENINKVLGTLSVMSLYLENVKKKKKNK